MTRRPRDTLTADLFELPPPAADLPASCDYRAQVSHLVGDMLKAAEGDRFEIASRMSRYAGHEVSKYMLDAYSSEARDTFNLPFWLAPAAEAACDTHALTNWLATVRGGRLLVGREVLNAKLGQLERIREEAGRQIRELKKQMGEAE